MQTDLKEVQNVVGTHSKEGLFCWGEVNGAIFRVEVTFELGLKVLKSGKKKIHLLEKRTKSSSDINNSTCKGRKARKVKSFK